MAGTGEVGFQDGPAAQAKMNSPQGLVYNAAHNCLYFCDNDNQRIRKVDLATQTVSTVAGTGEEGFQDGPAAQAKVNYPTGLVYDAAHNCLYFGDWGNHRIRKVDLATQTVSTVAGTGERGFQDGPAAQAEMSFPLGLMFDAAHNCLYFSDFYNHRVRKVCLLYTSPSPRD